MSFITGLLGGGKSRRTAPAAVSGLQLQSSTYGTPVPLCYGTNRVAPNLIWYGDFVSTQQQTSAGSGGKGGVGGGGGGKGGGNSGSFVYQTAVALGLCEGPIQGVGVAYVDKNVTSLSSLGLSAFLGSYPQAPWGYLVTNHSGSVAEAHTIPAVGPYTVTVAQPAGFVFDQGVAASSSTVTLTKVNGTPGYNQFAWDGNNWLTFNSANAGAAVTITYFDSYGQRLTAPAAIPTASPYTINFGSRGDPTTSVASVVATNVGFTRVSSAPAANQYTATAGVYTFNSANASQAITITYAFSGNNQALGYNGIAYVAASAYQLGSSPQLPNHNFEVQGVYSNSITVGGKTLPDADPSLVVVDLLTNTHYGAAFPAARVGSFTTYQAYCLASGLWISPLYNQQTQASALLDDLASATNSAFVWSSGLLTLVPYGDQNLTANGYTYTAPSAPLYDLGDDDFLPPQGGGSSYDPVQLVRKRPADQINSVKLECLDRSNSYNPAVIESKDQAFIDVFGLRAAPAKQSHLFCDLNAGRLSAQLQLQRQAIRNVYSFTVDSRYLLLDPMDIVTLTDTALGLNRQWVRLLEITENDDGSLSMTAEEYLNGTGHAPAYAFQTGAGFSADYNSSPGNANTPVLFEPTAQLSESLQVWLAASGGTNWGGCDVWLSQDGSTYKNIGRISGSARQGLLTAPLAAVTAAATGQTIDATNTLAVSLAQSGGQLLSASQADANALNSLCYVDGEYIAYQTATLTGSNAYNLTYLIRGAYGTASTAHAAGSACVRLDNGIFKFAYTQDYIGKTIYVKLTSFNIYGGGEQSLAGVLPYAYTLQGTALSSPLPNVTNLRSSYVAALTQLTWDEVADFRAVLYEIRKGSAWSGAQVLGRVAHPPFNTQGDGTYWVAAYSQPTAGLQVYSTAAQNLVISGSTITSNVIALYDEAATGWTGTVGGTAAVYSGTVRTAGSGNVLAIADYLTTPDLLNYGGEGNGTYEIPASHAIDIGRVAPCNVLIAWTSIGQKVSDNILTVSDYLNDSDILDYASSANVNVYPEIALSQDGTTFAPWQKYASGAYNARKFKARMQLLTYDPNVEAILTAFTFSVDVPDRDDHYISQSILAGGTTVAWQPDGAGASVPFNGGPAGSPTRPQVQVTVLNATQGDTVVLSGVSLTSGTIQVLNGGVGVARSVNILTQGY